MQTSNMIINAKGTINSKVMIGLPDAGLIGSITTSYIIEELNMKEIGYMDSDLFHSLIIVQNGIVKRPIRFYEKDGIIAIISDIPITPLIAMEFSKVLIDWIKSINATLIINVTGIPVQNRLSIEKPQVLALSTDTNNIKNIPVKPFNDGFIMGIYASIIKECINNNIPSLTLLAETYPNFPDPIASISVLEIINKILKLNIDLKRLENEAEIIRLKTRELMKQTENALARSKVSIPSIYR